jgi:hypothetical protein
VRDAKGRFWGKTYPSGEWVYYDPDHKDGPWIPSDPLKSPKTPKKRPLIAGLAAAAIVIAIVSVAIIVNGITPEPNDTSTAPPPPGSKERADEADSPASEEKVGPEAQETKPEQVPAPTPYPPPAPVQPVEEPALVAAENPAFSPAPLPAPVYPEPVYEEERSYSDYVYVE